MIFTKDDLIKSIKQIMPVCYTVKHYFGSIQFEKKEPKKLLRIGFGYNEYPGSYYPKGIIVYIKFTEVEDILNKVLDKYQIQQRYGESTVHSVLHDIAGVDYDKFKIEIHDESSFQTVAKEIKKTVEYGALPFFEKYSTLDKVNKELNKLDDEHVSTFLSGIVSLKIPLIKKIIHASDFREKLIRSKLFYEGEALEYPQYFKNHDKVFFDLFSEDLKDL